MPDDTDYYAGDDQAAPDTTADPAPDTAPKDDEQDAGSNSALVAKSVFGNSTPEVGSEVSMRVVHIYDDEVELEPVGKEKSESPAMDEAEEKLGSMAMMNGAAKA